MSSLLTAAGSLRFFESALATSQNNVANAGTACYASQRITPRALPFSPELGLPGGIAAGGLESARNEYAEQAVRDRLHGWGDARQTAATLSRIEAIFTARGDAGIPAALTGLFNSFSALAVAPNDAVARSAVVTRAGDLAARFREEASSLTQAAAQLHTELNDAVAQVNRLTASVRDWNAHARGDFRSSQDPNLDASLHASLEELAEYIDFTAIRQEDGSVMVLVGGGQAPLVIGDRQYLLEPSGGAGPAGILDASGNDITPQVGGGRVHALARLANEVMPGYIADLNRLAAGVADAVNAQLAAGLDAAGQPGAPLFRYDAAHGAALTMSANALGTAQLAAASAGAPGGNGNALALAGLASRPMIDGLGFTGFYGSLASRAGGDTRAASDSADIREQQFLQARALRDDASAVSLDEEAARIIEFQRAYQASAKLFAVLDEMLETTLNLLRR